MPRLFAVSALMTTLAAPLFRATYVLAQLERKRAGTTRETPDRERLDQQLDAADPDARVAAAPALLQADDAQRSPTTRPRE